MSNLKVEGKVVDFCPKCKNCKSTTRECDGEKDWLTEVECEDPYDGMKKTLNADSDICCSMFEPKPDRRCEKCERFDGAYCHGPNGTITISYKALFGEPVDCPSYSEKNETCDEESRIEELIKSSKRKDDLIQYYRETLKKANVEIDLLNSKLDKLGEYYRTNEKLIDNIQKVIFPQEEGSDYTYSYEEILKKVKDMLNTNKELTDKIGSLKNKIVNQKSTHYKQCARILELENAVSKLQSGEYDDILAKDIEIKSLQAKYEDAMAGWKNSMDTNDKLNQTISDLTESNENLAKAVERRDKWVEELKSDVDTLQNECLVIAKIAKRAYDETNRD